MRNSGEFKADSSQWQWVWQGKPLMELHQKVFERSSMYWRKGGRLRSANFCK